MTAQLPFNSKNVTGLFANITAAICRRDLFLRFLCKASAVRKQLGKRWTGAFQIEQFIIFISQ
jgi:hypothetical protein